MVGPVRGGGCRREARRRRVKKNPGECALRLRWSCLAVVVSALVASEAIAAQQADQLPPPPERRATYKSPLIEDEYTDQLKKLPDWNGAWIQQAAPKPRPAQMMFDPDHFYQPPIAGEPSATGPVAGSYLTDIPYKPEYQKQYMENVKNALEGRSIDRVGALCQPYGGIRLMGGAPSGPEITITPEMVIMYFDVGGQSRHIYTDGRPHPKPDEYLGKIQPRWNGHSIGHWENGTLVVDTVGFYPAFYDQTAPPYSDQVQVTERIRLVAWEWLENQITIVDPVMLTRPWTVTRYYRRSMGSKYPNANDYHCPPGENMDFSEGYQRVILPSEMEQKK
jgi:hypothetical protein